MSTVTFDTEKDNLHHWLVYLVEFSRDETTSLNAIDGSATAVSGLDVSNFPNDGYLKIDNEIVKYSSKTGTASGMFTLSERGAFNTLAASHASGVNIVEPIDKYWASHIDLDAGGLDISNDRALLKMPEGLKSTIEPDEGKSDISDLKLTMVDKNNRFSDVLSINPMRNRQATLWVGFNNLSASAFEKEFVGVVKNIRPSADYTKHDINISDLKRSYKNSLFTQIGKCRLASALTIAGLTLTVTSTAAASAGDRKFTDPASGYEIDTYVKVEDEIMGPVASITATTIVIESGGRGAFGTTAATHASGNDVNENIVINNVSAVSLILQLLTSTGDGTNGTYDVLPSHIGFGIDEDLVDVTTFETERDTFFFIDNVSFFIDDTIKEGKQWIEEQLLRLLGAYIITLGNGKLSFRVYHQQGNVIHSLTEDNMELRPVMNLLLPTINNQVLVYYSKRPDNGEYRELYERINADSISKHGSAPLSVLRFDGAHGTHSLLNDNLDGYGMVRNAAYRLTGRFGDVAPSLNTKLLPSLRDANVGELVEVTHSKLLNLTPASGSTLESRGITIERYEIVSKATKYSDKRIQVKAGLLRANEYDGWLDDILINAEKDSWQNIDDTTNTFWAGQYFAGGDLLPMPTKNVRIKVFLRKVGTPHTLFAGINIDGDPTDFTRFAPETVAAGDADTTGKWFIFTWPASDFIGTTGVGIRTIFFGDFVNPPTPDPANYWQIAYLDSQDVIQGNLAAGDDDPPTYPPVTEDTGSDLTIIYQEEND
jgi:hypothetical protein